MEKYYTSLEVSKRLQKKDWAKEKGLIKEVKCQAKRK